MSDTYDDFELDEPVRGGRTGMKIFLIGCASLFGLVLVLLMVLGFMVTSGYFPDTMVQTGEEMGGPVREQLEEAQILTDQDEVLLFYSYAMWNAADGGSAITTDGLVTWIVLDGELSIDPGHLGRGQRGRDVPRSVDQRVERARRSSSRGRSRSLHRIRDADLGPGRNRRRRTDRGRARFGRYPGRRGGWGRLMVPARLRESVLASAATYGR